ncbi:MAG: NlpC/P60 family protein [Nocardioidaceae bacterium]
MRPSVPRSGTPRGLRRVRIGVALAATGAICASSLTTATADEDTPTRSDVRSAKQHAADAARDVGEIKTQLAAAEQNVIDLGVEAGRMAEAYNGAMYKLQQARREARRNADAAEKAERQMDRTTDRLSSLIAANASQQNALRGLSAMLDDNGTTELLEQSSGFASIDDALASDLQRYDARKQVYEMLSDRADRAVDRKQQLAEVAEQAKAQADAAVAAAQDAAVEVRATRDDLIAELADAQGVSERLVRERQRDLAEQRRQDALEQAQEQDEEQVEEPPTDEDPTAPPDNEPTEPPDDGGTTDPPPDEGGTNEAPHNDGGDDPPPNDDNGGDAPPPDDGGDGPPPDDDTSPPPHDNGPPQSSGGVGTAIAYARAQLGEPYVYGAAGPSSWDCSGLTMMAWAAAGESLPHWSVAQYEATTPVSLGSIRRGDLLFWSNGSFGSIYHVAMYLGNGMMIHAPRPGRSVDVVSMYYWILPDLAGRV